MFRKSLDRGEAGDNAGILLRGIEKTDIKRGMVIVNLALLHLIRNLKQKYMF